jgi:hypothetical protein
MVGIDRDQCTNFSKMCEKATFCVQNLTTSGSTPSFSLDFRDPKVTFCRGGVQKGGLPLKTGHDLM